MHLEQVQHAATFKAARSFSCVVFEKHNFLNKVAALLRLYTEQTRDNESVLAITTPICQLAAIVKSMPVRIEDSGTGMALLSGLFDCFDSLISASDATCTDSDSSRSTFSE